MSTQIGPNFLVAPHNATVVPWICLKLKSVPRTFLKSISFKSKIREITRKKWRPKKLLLNAKIVIFCRYNDYRQNGHFSRLHFRGMWGPWCHVRLVFFISYILKVLCYLFVIFLTIVQCVIQCLILLLWEILQTFWFSKIKLLHQRGKH